MLLKMFSPYRKVVHATLAANLRNLSTTTAVRKNHYEVLEISRDATQAEIKNAYFKLTKLYHPDRIAATDDSLKKFRAVSEAYEVLGNENSRKLYDRGLLEEVKRVGGDTDPTDPIIAFYKQRQDMAKIIESDSDKPYMQTHLRELKKKKYHDLFSMKTTRGLRIQNLYPDFLTLGYLSFFTFLLLLNFEGSPPEKFYKKWKKYLNL